MAKRIHARHSAEIRQKIQGSQLVNRLTQHVLGEVELSSTQLKAAEILLSKCLPNLSSVEVDASVESRKSLDEYSDAELQAIIAGSSGSDTATPDSATELH